MKICAFCDEQNPDPAIVCRACGHALLPGIARSAGVVDLPSDHITAVAVRWAVIVFVLLVIGAAFMVVLEP